MRRGAVYLSTGLLAYLACVGVGVVLGLGAYTAHYAEGLSYLSNDPKSCVNCHVMRDQYDSWQKASHHATATCNDCHIPAHGLAKWLVKAENGFWHSKGFTLQDFHEPIMIRVKNRTVLDANCVHCHEGLVHDIHLFNDTAGQEGCVRCHAGVGHGALH
jgi:cytochrome c nitrite reductase small subunit